jgi:hypothetical protein
VADEKRYLIDTDVLAHIRFRQDSGHIYDEIAKAVHAGWVRTVKQVPDELKKWPTIHARIKPLCRKMIVPAKEQFSREVRAMNQVVQDNAPFLFQQVGGKNPDPADPWLIAVAKAHGYIVVTNEKPTRTTAIPAVCRMPAIKCPCINGAQFVLETGIVKTIDPSEVSASAFFGYGQGA